jgi:hypothetical protein
MVTTVPEDQMTAARADSVSDSPHADLSVGRSPAAETPAERTCGELATVTDMTEHIAARGIVDEAKRLLMAVGNLTEPEAHRWIQKTAMDRRAPKQAIALGIIEALSEKA